MTDIGIICIYAFLQILGLMCLKYCNAGIFRLCKLKIVRLDFFLHKIPAVRLLSAYILSSLVLMPYLESELFSVPIYFIYFYLVVSDKKRRKYLTGKEALARLIFLSVPMIIIGCYQAPGMNNCAAKYIYEFWWTMFLMFFPFIYLLVVKRSKIRLVKFIDRHKIISVIVLIGFFVEVFFLNFECQPLAAVITILFFGIVPYIFMGDSPKYLWVVYLLVVIWLCHINNYSISAEDEMMWRTNDSLIDYSEQWHDNYACYLMVTGIINGVMYASFWNILIFFVYKLFAHDTSCSGHNEEL